MEENAPKYGGLESYKGRIRNHELPDAGADDSRQLNLEIKSIHERSAEGKDHTFR